MNKGFIATLEAVIASALFLIFLINVLPGFTETTTETSTLQKRATGILSSLDSAGKLQPLVIQADVAGLDSLISPHLTGLNTVVGLTYTNITSGSYRGGTLTRTFQVNTSTAREETLHVRIKSSQGLQINISGEEVIDTPGSSVITRDISQYTQNGDNTLTIDASSGKLDYAIRIQNYRQHGRLPPEGDITAVTYPVV
ncbi:MAG: hypothetical protein SVU32_01845, partial [Candidatus Nanohaloarchaea archaeon]|nr:hypothetical protein [Candidatus Nanohaloarchaea archaeon]